MLIPEQSKQPNGFNVAGHKYGLLTKPEVKMAGFWLSSSFCVFMDQDH